MTFSHIVRQTIDTSPAPWAENIELLFVENDLIDIEPQRYERFFRVWFTQRHEYAPKLSQLIIVLRPTIRDNVIRIDGIQVFMRKYHQYIMNTPINTSIWFDDYAEDTQSLYQISVSPTRII